MDSGPADIIMMSLGDLPRTNRFEGTGRVWVPGPKFRLELSINFKCEFQDVCNT